MERNIEELKEELQILKDKLDNPDLPSEDRAKIDEAILELEILIKQKESEK